MRIAIVGAGATGSIYAGLLASAGNEVWAVDRWREHVDAIRERGLRVTGASGDRVVRLHATDDPAEVGVVDLVVLATKAYDVEDAARNLGPLIGDGTVVLPIQNGIGSVERVASIVGAERVIVGVVGGFGASIVAPGHVHHHGMELVRLGERGAPASDRVEGIAAVWRQAGFTVRAFDDVDQLVWEKLICNVAFSATCAITRVTVGEVLDSPDLWSVSERCASEAYEVARAMGVGLGFDDPSRYVRDFGRKIAGAQPSMLIDVLSGRRTEIDAINGAIPRLATPLGLAAPVNETVSALVRGIQRDVG